ncbi:MAG: glycerophosphodiester phosphodiesterase family protein [Actinomycetaceae bacterium]|nr:glycerophosphodiester phosphodiesterase family protein [Actinomycetaceae bacterium]
MINSSKERLVFSHRGLNQQAPENTMSAFAPLPSAGVTWFETDVDITADGTLLIMHDETLDRTTNASGPYDNLCAAKLACIDAGSWFNSSFAGEPIPTLPQIVDFMNSTGLSANIEIKSNRCGRERTFALIDGVIAELSRVRSGVDYIVSSFNPLLLAEFKRRAPHIRVGCLFSNVTLGADWLSILELVGADFIHPEDEGLTAAQIREFIDRGYGVNVWTVNERQRAEQLFDWGVSGIFTDRADEFIDLQHI